VTATFWDTHLGADAARKTFYTRQNICYNQTNSTNTAQVFKTEEAGTIKYFHKSLKQ